MAQIRVQNLQTGQTGTMEDWDYNPQQFKRLDTPQPEQTQPQQEEGGLLRSLLPTGASILGGILGAPLGVPGIIGGSALFGGGARALTGGNLGDVAKEAALSGIGGIFPASRLLKAGKAAKAAGAAARAAEGVGAQTGERAGENILTKAGSSLRRTATVAPKSSLDTFSQQQLLQQTIAKYPKLRGSGTAKFQKVEGIIDDLVSQVDDKLTGVNTSIPGINIARMADNIAQTMDPNDQRNFVRVFNRTVKNVFGETIPDNLTPLQINQLRRGFNRQATAAYKSVGKGGVLSAPNQAIIELRDLTDDLLEQTVPKNIRAEISPLNKDISTLIKGIPEFKDLSESTFKLPVLGIPVPGAARAGQAGQDLLGRGLAAGGQAAGKIPMPANLTPNIIGQVGTRALIGGPEEAQAAELSPMEGSLISPPGQSEQEQFRKALGMYALSKAKSPAELTSAYNLLYPKKASTEAADQFLQKASENIAALEASPSLGYGPLAGKFAEFQLGTLGGAGTSKDVVALNQRYNLLKLNILRAYQGARISDKDFELARLYIPSISDTEQTARTKLKILGDILVNAQPQEETSTSQSTIPMPANFGL